MYTKNIILTGPKHCGKTGAGKALAELCSCIFIDLDEEISKTTGKTPRELYIEGPDVFQKAEVETLRNITQRRGDAEIIIATGGGIIDNREAIDIIKNSKANVVYLNISAAAAWQRIANGGELPPFLRTENPQETHRLLHTRRAAAYSRLASITIETEGMSPGQIADVIFSQISEEI